MEIFRGVKEKRKRAEEGPADTQAEGSAEGAPAPDETGAGGAADAPAEQAPAEQAAEIKADMPETAEAIDRTEGDLPED
jgi:hypothetical protein